MISFKERVKNEAILNSQKYQSNFVNFEYLVCSEAFINGYHILKSDKGNYLHLIGVHTTLKAEEFFDKCINGTLEESDFDFIRPGKSEKSVKGSVREKITVLPYMVSLFEQSLKAEDGFKKNKVDCAFATSDNKCTLGFAVSGHPKSLLKGNELDKNKVKDVELIFRRPRGSIDPYKELIYGDKKETVKYRDKIGAFISKDFFVVDNIESSHEEKLYTHLRCKNGKEGRGIYDDQGNFVSRITGTKKEMEQKFGCKISDAYNMFSRSR